LPCETSQKRLNNRRERKIDREKFVEKKVSPSIDV
jgi:hypothetical protein